MIIQNPAQKFPCGNAALRRQFSRQNGAKPFFFDARKKLQGQRNVFPAELVRQKSREAENRVARYAVIGENDVPPSLCERAFAAAGKNARFRTDSFESFDRLRLRLQLNERGIERGHRMSHLFCQRIGAAVRAEILCRLPSRAEHDVPRLNDLRFRALFRADDESVQDAGEGNDFRARFYGDPLFGERIAQKIGDGGGLPARRIDPAALVGKKQTAQPFQKS